MCDELDKLEDITCFLKEEFELDPDDVEEMVGEFVENGDKLIISATNALGESNWDELMKVAHSLKGMCLNVGAAKLAAKAKVLEDIAPRHDGEACGELIEDLKIRMESFNG